MNPKIKISSLKEWESDQSYTVYASRTILHDNKKIHTKINN